MAFFKEKLGHHDSLVTAQSWVGGHRMSSESFMPVAEIMKSTFPVEKLVRTASEHYYLL